MSKQNEKTFLDDLLKEAEEKERQQDLAYFDLCIMKIAELRNKISENFKSADKEKEIISDWSITENEKIQHKIDHLERQLEGWLRESKEKTKVLPHGVIKMRKSPDRIEIENLEIFMNSADQSTLSITPETRKPDLNKIKSLIRKTGIIPEGVNIVQGVEKLTVTIKEN